MRIFRPLVKQLTSNASTFSGKDEQTVKQAGYMVFYINTILLLLWDKFPTARTVNQMMETMERIMEEPFAYSVTWPSPLPTEIGSVVGDQRRRWRVQDEIRHARDD